MCSSIIDANLLAAFSFELASITLRLDARLLVIFCVFFLAG
jgi:hypothetical protein